MIKHFGGVPEVSNVDLMMEGFYSLEEYFKKNPLGTKQKFLLGMLTAGTLAAKWSTGNEKAQVDIHDGLESKTKNKLRNRGKRRRELNGGYYLSESEAMEFEINGTLKPFPVISRREALNLKKRAYQLHERGFDENIIFGNEAIASSLKKRGLWNINYSGIYQALRFPEWWDLLKTPEMSQRMASLLGDDIICWRSQFFEKAPGAAGTFWHQTGSFQEFSKRSKLTATRPMDDSNIQLTGWIALSDTTIENGCMRILPGSFKDGRFEQISLNLFKECESYLLTQSKDEIKKILAAIRFTPGNFIKAQLAFEIALREIPDLFDGFDVVDLEMKAGEGVIFSSLNTHASYPNITQGDTRLGFAGRYTSNDVKVYDGWTEDVFPTPEGAKSFSLENVASIQVHGEDRFGHNKIASREDLIANDIWKKTA